MPEWLQEFATGSYADHTAIGIIEADHEDVPEPTAVFQPHVLEQAAAAAKKNGFERVSVSLIPATGEEDVEGHILAIRNQRDDELAIVAAPVIPSEDDEQMGVDDG